MHVRWRGSLIEIHTPAKVNLFLEILARRSDGFHELETLMATIDRYDTLRISYDPDGIRLTTRWACGLSAGGAPTALSPVDRTWGRLPDDDQNLVYRAAARLREVGGIGGGARIELIKRIPAEAGLGGASSDAAAALVGLNELWRLGQTRGQLGRLGAELGSDVPFFLGTGAAVCRGRGEKVESVVGGGRLHLVIVRPPEGLSTAAVYRECRPAESAWRVEPLLRAFRRGDALGVARGLRNRLQEPASRLSPWIGCLRDRFQRLGCLGHQMSGSGTSYFGVVRTQGLARRAASQLRASGMVGAFAASTMGWASSYRR
jgi:4-diphosphocytidyl-2-C-methyl-D-erythritol kinase